MKLRSIKLSNKIEQTLSDPYALVIWQNDESADSKEVAFHSHMRNRGKSYRFFLVERNVASDASAELAV
jgi:hypothetical protein